MSCLKANFSVSEPHCIDVKNRAVSGSFRVCSSIVTVEVNKPIPRDFSARNLDLSDQNTITTLKMSTPKLDPVIVQPSVCISKSQKWWEKSLQPNMAEIQSAQQLVDFLKNAGDTLVVVNFYSPGCGGCRTLHPKICQQAGMSPDAHFLTINYEQHRAMCHALNVHVLPFFKFYRGAEGKVCSFSCTNATIKKFKDALSKHGADQRGPGPAKGLQEGEMASLASHGLLSRELVPIWTEEDQMKSLGI